MGRRPVGSRGPRLDRLAGCYASPPRWSTPSSRTPEPTTRTRPAASSPDRRAPTRPTRLVPMTNAERSPTFYRFDSGEQLRLYRELDAADEEVVVVYHSHTATEAYPSRTDIAYAGEPQAHYVLVSTREPDTHEFRSYRIVDGDGERRRPWKLFRPAPDVAPAGKAADRLRPRFGPVFAVSDNEAQQTGAAGMRWAPAESRGEPDERFGVRADHPATGHEGGEDRLRRGRARSPR